MGKADYIFVLRRMDRLIRLKSTGNPEDFAGRLSMSKRSLYYYLDLLRDLGAPISYSRHFQSYFYIEQGGFNFEFKT